MSAERISAGLRALAAGAERATALAPQVARVAERYAATLRAGGTLWFAGNGGSAADAQHLATEYAVRYGRDRRAYAAAALTTDTSLLTAAGNDLGFERVFARQVEALCRPGDLLVLHSTSGRSPNLLRAAEEARAKGVAVVGFLGRDGGELAGLVDEAVIVPADETSHIQELHLALEHLVVECVEEALGG
ncbi:MAG TPA: SIS domain-containing protein [Gemmatimonadales bacterium]|nr:SIS domain-containing protein [Gemmatimonadales bacterium]